MATNLIFYKSTVPSSLLLYAEYYYKCHAAGITLTAKDVNGVSNTDLGTYISGLVDATYTEIMIASACESTAQSTATDTLNLANQYDLRAKLIVASQGTYTTESAVADTHTATTIGNTAAFTAINSEVGTPDSPNYVVISTGTGNGQLSTIKSNTVDALTIYGVFYAAPDGTSKYKRLSGSKLFVVGQAQAQSATVTKTRAELGWTALYPGITLPVINSYFAGVPGYALYTGTMTSACGAATLTDSGLGATTNQYAGYYAVVYNATANGYQYGKILSNTATVITLTANWGGSTPTGTGKIWRIYARETDCLKDVYFTLYLMLSMNAVPTNSTHLANLTKLIDNNGSLANGTAYKQTLQDWTFLAYTQMIGKGYHDCLLSGVALSVPA